MSALKSNRGGLNKKPNELIPCDVCGNGIYEGGLIAVEHGTVHVYRECYDAYARSCSVCGEMYLRTNMHSLRVEYDGYSYVCPECAESDSVSGHLQVHK